MKGQFLGCFYQKAIAIVEREARLPGRSCPIEEAMMLFHLEDLTARLDELNEIRPHKPPHSLFDRYFYEDYLIEALHRARSYQSNRLGKTDHQKTGICAKKIDRFIAAVKATGANPDGQLVIIGLFIPFISESSVPA